MATKIIRGPCKVYQGGVEVGKTESASELNDEPQFVEGKTVCTGDGVYDEMKNGSVVTLTVPFTALTPAGLAKLGGTIVGNKIVFSNEVGSLTRAESEEVILKPCVDQNVSTDPTEWTTVYLAYPKRKFALSYGPEQRVYDIEYQAYSSEVSGQIGRYYEIGENG
jgi:hypothetical protein